MATTLPRTLWLTTHVIHAGRRSPKRPFTAEERMRLVRVRPISASPTRRAPIALRTRLDPPSQPTR
ncbi:hypothetical protein ASJ30_14555 [Janibacter indicus]|uniref:Uncharacterized protein n=1 Tax=Janibacter indicus TaxID=857417 RepID=A0A1L3MJN6_9MICO|nr:hypothetical protein ASJ30_14555 [Janibacter indicus]